MLQITRKLLPMIILIGIPLYIIMEHGHIVLIVIGVIIIFVIASVIYGAYHEKTAYKPQNVNDEFNLIDSMSGVDFENYIASMLRRLGYSNVTVTKASGDYGADILASYKNIRCAFQCKRYGKNVGLKPIQEIYTAKQYYHCDRAVVVTNMRFSQNARNLAKQTGVELWDRDVLLKKISQIIKEVN